MGDFLRTLFCRVFGHRVWKCVACRLPGRVITLVPEVNFCCMDEDCGMVCSKCDEVVDPRPSDKK